MSLPCEHPTHPLPPPWTPGVQTLGTERKGGGWGLDSWVLGVDELERRYFWVLGAEGSRGLNTLVIG